MTDIELNNIYDISFITINGMSCASCSASIEYNINSLEGIKNISVNLITKTAVVEYNPHKINLRGILSNIENLGFDAFLQNDESKEEKVLQKLQKEKHSLKNYVVFLSFFGFLGVVGMLLMILDVKFYNTEVYPGLSVSMIYMFILSTPVQFGIGLQFYKNVWKQLKYNTNFNMETLIVLSTTLAYTLSICLVSLNILNRKVLHHTFFETSVFVYMFVYIGKYLELLGKIWAAKIMNSIVSNDISTVTLIKDFNNLSLTEDILESLICIGDIIKVKPNDKIPCDGKVIFNESFVNESMLSGEFETVHKIIGSNVYSGTINVSNTIYIEALETGNNTLINKMVSLIENAQSNKTSFQSTTDWICKWFVYIVITIAIITFIVWFVLGTLNLVDIPLGFTPITFALYFSISVIVVACPCALGLATPMAIMVGTGIAMNKGILIKNGADTIEKMSKVKAIVFDKTGTLTYGKMHVVEMYQELFDENYLNYTKTLSCISNHPVSKCLLSYTHHYRSCEYINEQISLGLGVSCYIDSDIHKLGSVKWLDKEYYSSPMKEKLEEWYSYGYSIVAQSKNDKIVCMFAISDIVRDDAKNVFSNLNNMGIDLWVASGDNHFNASKVANYIGISNERVLSNVLPEAKSNIIESLQCNGYSVKKSHWFYKNGYVQMSKKIVAMVGDGGNDSIALSQADIGIAMCHGSDLALSSASVVLMKSDIKDVLNLKVLSDKIMKRIYINLLWAMSYNIIAIPLAAGVFYPLHISPLLAALMMSLSSLFVVGNSILLKYQVE